MSVIQIRRAHHTSQHQAKKIANQIAEQLARDYQLRATWDGDTMRFSRRGLQGSLTVGNEELSLHIELGLLMAAFKAPIQQAVEARLEALLPKPSAKRPRPKTARGAAKG